jgi:hypothetical protein
MSNTHCTALLEKAIRFLYFLLIREHISFRGLRKRVLGNVTVMTAGSEAARGTECAGGDTGGGALLPVSSTLKAVNERACIVLLRPKRPVVEYPVPHTAKSYSGMLCAWKRRCS